MSFPTDIQDISNIRVVPDHQEVWTDSLDNTIIIELLDYKTAVPAEDAGAFFFQDLAEASEASSNELNYASILPDATCPGISPEVEKCGAVGCHIVAKFRDEDKSGASARNKVMVYVINLRLKDVGTDMLVTMYRTIQIGESSSTTEVKTVEVDENNDFPALDLFLAMVRTLEIVDYGLFG